MIRQKGRGRRRKRRGGWEGRGEDDDKRDATQKGATMKMTTMPLILPKLAAAAASSA